MLHNLAINNAQNVYPRDLYTFASRSNAQVLSLVGAARGHTSYYLISLGDHVFYIYTEVGEGGVQRGEQLLYALTAGALSGIGIVVDYV